jgi:sphinganine-1-phosphate aldolase
MFFQYASWPGGLFVSPSMLGSRGGAPIAAAWASLVFLGEKGLCDLLSESLTFKDAVQESLRSDAVLSRHLRVIGEPVGTVLSFRSVDPRFNIYAVADVVEERHGWKCERQQLPPSIHLTCMPAHAPHAQAFVESLKEAVEEVAQNPEK